MTTRCERCGKDFKYPSVLQRHLVRKTPCDPILVEERLSVEDRQKPFKCRYCGRPFSQEGNMHRHVRNRCKIASSDEGMEKLMDFTIARQLKEQQQETAALREQVAELASLLKQQLSVAPTGAVAINNHTTTRVTVNNVHQTVGCIIVHNWNAPGGPLPAFDAEFLVRVFNSCTELKGYCELPQAEQIDPDIAPPFVARALVETVREAHRDPVHRNVYLNPKRADQVLVCVEEDGKQRWEVRQALETSRDLFDAAVSRMRKTVLSDVERPKMPQKVQDAAAWVPIMYESTPERYVADTKAPMAAVYDTARRNVRDAPR